MFGKPHCSVEQVTFWRRKHSFLLTSVKTLRINKSIWPNHAQTYRRLNHVYNSAGLLEGNDGIMKEVPAHKSPTISTNQPISPIEKPIEPSTVWPSLDLSQKTLKLVALLGGVIVFVQKKTWGLFFCFGPFMAFLMAFNMGGLMPSLILQVVPHLGWRLWRGFGFGQGSLHTATILFSSFLIAFSENWWLKKWAFSVTHGSRTLGSPKWQ